MAIDVGANAGTWSVKLSRCVGASGTVVAYEALPHYSRALTLVTKLIRARNVVVRAVAVGDTERVIGLRWRTDGGQGLGGLTHVEPYSRPHAGVLAVPMVPLDKDLEALRIDPSRVAFIKIDVEGAELEVLRGADNLLRVGRPAVYLEAEPKWLARWGHSVSDVFDHMRKYNYKSYLVSGTKLLPTSAEDYISQYETKRDFNNVLFLPSAKNG